MANFFRRRRDELNKTQREIAEAFDPHLTPATISAWEQSVAGPEMTRVDEVAKVYGVSRIRILEAMHDLAHRRERKVAAESAD